MSEPLFDVVTFELRTRKIVSVSGEFELWNAVNAMTTKLRCLKGEFSCWIVPAYQYKLGDRLP
jgi:hypothetical protein